MIDEANEIAKQLNQNVKFDFGLSGNKNASSALNPNFSSFDISEK